MKLNPKTQLTNYFKTANLPESATIETFLIINVPKFVESHLRYINNNDKEKFIKPYFDRLVELKNIIENEL